MDADARDDLRRSLETIEGNLYSAATTAGQEDDNALAVKLDGIHDEVLAILHNELA